MSIGDFFKKIGDGIKKAVEAIGHAFSAIIIKLFGAQAVHDFVTAVENLIETEFGNVLKDAIAALLAGIPSGTPFATVLAQVVALIISEGEKAGITIGEDLAHLLGTLILNWLNGNLTTAQVVAKQTLATQ
jgi:hypothetical protein